MISSTEAKLQIAVQSFTSVNMVIGGMAGVIVGQVAISVPVPQWELLWEDLLETAGKGLGNLEGRGVPLLTNDKDTDLATSHCSLLVTFVSM